MVQLVADCPRCGALKTAFNVLGLIQRREEPRHGWMYRYEVFSCCLHCRQSTTFVVADKLNGANKVIGGAGFLQSGRSLNDLGGVEGFISIKDSHSVDPPEYLPSDIQAVFVEGARCAAVGCYNAAGTMFRLSVDLATLSRLPVEEMPGLNHRTRRDLGLRLPWLFANNLLPIELQELSTCIKEDGNDGAHRGTLKKEDAEDLLDFTVALLERLYTEPERLRLAAERRAQRRG
jgi:hypothetical protein